MTDPLPPGHRANGVAAVIVAAVLLGGCAGLAKIGSVREPAAAARAAAPEAEVARAERAAARRPADPTARARLGRAYLAAGRFASAAEALDDALQLGDTTPATVIGLALAEIAGGDRTAAVQLLDDWQAFLPSADRGLALALAGEPGRAVEVLAGALRGGESSPLLRQNLAFAYALDRRWREAWLLAGQDLPPAERDRRVAQWAALTGPELARHRVAHLLGAPLGEDRGYPRALALAADRPSAAAADDATALSAASEAQTPLALP